MSSKRNSVWTLKLGPPRGGGGRASFSYTWPGVIFTGAILMIGLAALNAGVNLLFLILGLALGLLIVSGAITRGSLRRVHVTREAPDAVIAGRPFTARYRVHNQRGHGDVFSLRICELLKIGPHTMRVEGYVAAVPSNQTVTLDVSICAPVRGTLQFNTVNVSTRFPFGLFGRSLRINAGHETTVFPALLPLRRRLDSGKQNAAWQAMAAREQKRGADEFYGLREHRQGESLRWIHWRSSARTGQLLVREMMDLRPQTVMVVLDSYLPPGVPESQRENAISAAGTILCHALETGFKVGLIALAKSPIIVPPATGRGLRSRLMSQLAVLGDASAEPQQQALESHRWPSHWRGRCFLIAPAAHNGLWRLANTLRSAATTVDVITPRDAEYASWFEVGVPRTPLALVGEGVST